MELFSEKIPPFFLFFFAPSSGLIDDCGSQGTTGCKLIDFLLFYVGFLQQYSEIVFHRNKSISNISRLEREYFPLDYRIAFIELPP